MHSPYLNPEWTWALAILVLALVLAFAMTRRRRRRDAQRADEATRSQYSDRP